MGQRGKVTHRLKFQPISEPFFSSANRALCDISIDSKKDERQFSTRFFWFEFFGQYFSSAFNGLLIFWDFMAKMMQIKSSWNFIPGGEQISEVWLWDAIYFSYKNFIQKFSGLNSQDQETFFLYPECYVKNDLEIIISDPPRGYTSRLPKKWDHSEPEKRCVWFAYWRFGLYIDLRINKNLTWGLQAVTFS